MPTQDDLEKRLNEPDERPVKIDRLPDRNLTDVIPTPEITRIKPGEEGQSIMPYSEVCMHLRVAGKMMRFRLIENARDARYAPSVQLLNPDGTELSFPIGAGEGGVYYDYDRWEEGEDREYKWYYYRWPPTGGRV